MRSTCHTNPWCTQVLKELQPFAQLAQTQHTNQRYAFRLFSAASRTSVGGTLLTLIYIYIYVCMYREITEATFVMKTRQPVSLLHAAPSSAATLPMQRPLVMSKRSLATSKKFPFLPRQLSSAWPGTIPCVLLRLR